MELLSFGRTSPKVRSRVPCILEVLPSLSLTKCISCRRIKDMCSYKKEETAKKARLKDGKTQISYRDQFTTPLDLATSLLKLDTYDFVNLGPLSSPKMKYIFRVSPR